MSTERLEPKEVHGHVYYYYTRWAWRDGKCRRVWQKYLGKLEDIAAAVEGGPEPAYAEVFQYGLPSALWLECGRQRIVEQIDRLCPKRRQGLTVGEYLAVAAVNRAIRPVSKQSMWEWFASTTLRRYLPDATEAALASQRFWDHMEAIPPAKAVEAWTAIIGSTIGREAVDLSRVSYDGTNFYSFISTFNLRSRVAARGKNKQGRGNLRQVSYAVFCSRDGLPLYYDLYEGNRADARQFPVMVERFEGFLGQLGPVERRPAVTIIFDKGNNSRHNIELLDDLKLDFIGSLKLREHRELALISNGDARWVACAKPGLEKGMKAFTLEKTVYGKPRRLVMVFNPQLHADQRRTLENDRDKALERLAALSGRLEARLRGEIQGGRAPSEDSVRREVARILKRPFLREIVSTTVTPGPRLEFAALPEELERIGDTWLGKRLLITNPKSWSDDEIVEAYHGQYVIEHLFREMKHRDRPNWWPLHHWTDDHVRVHAFYCTVAVLLRALLHRRVLQAGISISTGGLYRELDAVREIVNVYPPLRRKKQRTSTVLSRASELQQRIMQVLGLTGKPF